MSKVSIFILMALSLIGMGCGLTGNPNSNSSLAVPTIPSQLLAYSSPVVQPQPRVLLTEVPTELPLANVDTLRLTPGATAAALVSYVSWSDPNENAFDLEVPRGWSVTGGMFRPFPIQPKPMTEIVSPDGMTYLVVGDKDYPSYIYGNVVVNSGLKDGDLYKPNGTINYVVMNYVGPQRFIQYYINTRWANSCSDLQILEVNSLTDLSTQLSNQEKLLNTGETPVRIDVAEGVFSCSYQGQEMSGYYLTKLRSENININGVTGTIWWLDGVVGFLAPLQYVSQAWNVMIHVYKTVQVNPQWVAQQQQITEEAAQKITQHTQETNQLVINKWTQMTCNWNWYWRCVQTPEP